MFCTRKVFLILASLMWDLGMADSEAVKRESIPPHQPGLEFLHFGNFGPVSRLPNHPTFSHLGLTPQQTTAFVDILVRNGLLAPHALRLANGQPLVGHSFPRVFHGVGFVPDPYFLYLTSNYERFLPFGLGPQGFYGSTGLPRARPLGVFNYDKH